MTALASAAADYLGVRRAMGYKLQDAGRLLPRFVAYLDDVGADTVTVALAVAWASEVGHGRAVAGRLRVVRGFARYLQALDPANEVPPTGLVPDRSARAVPHLYSEDDVVALMGAASVLEPPLRAATTATVIGVLAVTGMRIGEVLALNLGDIDWDTGVVTVWLAKFNNSRHVPVAPSTVAALADYHQTAGRLAPTATSPALFVTASGQRLSYHAFKTAFDRLVDAAGVVSASGRRPRVQDFRHGFAVRTVLGWYRDGADVHALLPRLSTYLGHVSPASTYWYLSAAPELMALAADRIDNLGDGLR